MLHLNDASVLQLQSQRELDGYVRIFHHAEEADFLRDRIGYVQLEIAGYLRDCLPEPFAGLHARDVLDELHVGSSGAFEGSCATTAVS